MAHMRTNERPRCLFRVLAVVLTVPLLVRANVAECPGNVFVEGSGVSVGGGPAEASFTLNDWRGNRCGSGAWNEKGRAELGTMGVGYYRIATGTNAPVCFAVARVRGFGQVVLNRRQPHRPEVHVLAEECAALSLI